jgi:pimeloyl-ACP methyl ester carboxylesterase
MRGFMKRLPLYLPMLLPLLIAGCAPSAPATIAATPTASPTITLTPTAAPTVAPSGLVDVGGYSLYYWCEGEGVPAVIFESGYAVVGTRGSWNGIAAQLRDHTRVCAYDRVSLGRSDLIDEAVTSQQVAKDLHDLLHNAGIPGPYVLVAHSIGGWHARVFTQQYRDEVAGLILIDASHPDYASAMLAALPAPSPDEPEAVTEARAGWENPVGTLAEPMDMAISVEQVRATGPFGDLPLVVLSRDPELVEGWLPLEIEQDVNAVWQTLQADLATLSTNSTHTIVEGAGHGIHLDQPRVVIDAIRAMIEQISGEGE